MNKFKLTNSFIILFLAGIIMISCSKDDDSGPVTKAPNADQNEPVDSTDTTPVIDSLNYFNITVSGAISGEIAGKPKIIIQDKSFSSFLFFTDGAIAGFRLNRNSHGIPIDFLDPDDDKIAGGGWTPTPGTYQINRGQGTQEGEASYYPIVFDYVNDRQFGGHEELNSTGTITLTEVGYDAAGYGYMLGTFEFEAFNGDEKVTLTGDFRMALIS